jgi:hypothetical protein
MYNGVSLATRNGGGDMMKSRKPTQPPKQQRMRGRSRYRHSEVTRLLKGAIAAGLRVVGVEADAETGRLRVLVGKPDAEDRDNPASIIKNL